jgi:hypothetical protein
MLESAQRFLVQKARLELGREGRVFCWAKPERTTSLEERARPCGHADHCGQHHDDHRVQGLPCEYTMSVKRL